MISIDLQKVFDTVNNNILLKTMELKDSLKKQQNGSNLIFQIGNSKFILRILCQNLETSCAEVLKDLF